MMELIVDKRRRAPLHSIRNRFRPLLAAVLLGLPLWVGLTAEATAQTVNADGTYTVPQDWALKPSAINAGGSFRLMFRTTSQHRPGSSDLDQGYSRHVRNSIAGGHAAIRPYSSAFRVLGSTATVHARDHAMTTGTGVPIYWLGGAKVADNYTDFHDGSWDSPATRNEDGSSVSQSFSALTGSNDDGTAFTGQELGSSGRTRTGSGAGGLDSGASVTSLVSAGLFGLSPVFVVASTTSVISIAAGTSPVTEGTEADFTVTATPAPSANLTVNLSVADASGSDFVPAGNSGAQTVTVTTSGSAIYSVPTVDDSTAETRGPVTVTVAGSTAYTVGASQNSASVTILDDDATPAVTVTETNGNTRVIEGGTTDEYVVALTAPPASDVTITPTSAAPGTARVSPSALTFTNTNWHVVRSITVTGVDNDDDAADQEVTITHAVSSTDTDYSSLIPAPVTVAVRDDEPTIVSLTRNGSGAVDEGGTVRFTIALSRALTAGEGIFVPFFITGTGVTMDDWELEASGTGVTLSYASSFGFSFLNFDEEGAMSATLVLTPVNDNTAEGGGTGSETYTIAFGPNNADLTVGGFDGTGVGNNVGGGADPHSSDNSFNVRVNDPTPGVTITETNGATMPTEGGTDDEYTMVLTTQPSANVTITPTSGTPATATISPSSLIFTSANWNTAQTITVSGEDNSADAANQQVTITHAIMSTDSTYSAITPAPVTATVIDDEPTVVSLTRPGSDTGAIDEGAAVTLIIELSRRLIDGETIDVPLSISGTNVTPDDWNLTLSDTSFGATLSGEETSTPQLRISNAASLGGANLILTPTFDETDEGGTETYTIALGPNDATANGFDRTTLGTNVGGGADPHSSDNDFDLEVLDSVRHTMSLSLNSAMGAEGDSGLSDGATLTITVDPPNPRMFDFLLNFGGTAIRGGNDYTVARSGFDTDISAIDSQIPLRITGDATLQYRIRANGDTVDESGETVIISLSRASIRTPANVIIDEDATTVTYTITDDDTAGVTISETDDATTPTEGGTDQYTMVLDTQPTTDVTIMATSGTTATATINPSSLTFTSANWNTAQTITVSGVDNNADAANQQVTITHAITSSDTNYSGLTPDPVTATVIDDEPTVVSLTRFGGDTGAIDEGVPVILVVDLSRQLINGETIDVPLSISGTNVTPADWNLALSDTSLGATLSGEDTSTPLLRISDAASFGGANLILTPTFDETDEGGTETYTIALGPDGAGTNGFDRTTLSTNVGGGADPHSSDNGIDLEVLDAVRHTMSLSLDSEMGAEGDSGLTDGATMTVTMDPPNPRVIPLDIQLGGTATRGGNDYSVFIAGFNTDLSASNPSRPVINLNFPANRATVQFRVRANGDTVDESNETVTLALGRVTGTNATPTSIIFEEDATTVTYTITDDDTAGVTLTETNDATTLAEDGGTDDYGMMLTSQPTADVTITPTSGTLATATVSPLSLTFSNTNWATAQTFTVTGANNNADAANQQVTISHAITSADSTYEAIIPAPITATVTDNDATTVTLGGTAGNINEGVTRNLTVTLNRALAAGESLAVPLTLGGTATRGTDYTLTGTDADGIAYTIPDTGNVGTVTFTGPALATATLALVVQVDGTSDASETITIALGTLDSNSGTGLGGGASGTGSLAFTITEDPTIVLPLTLTVAEGDTDGVGYPVSLATAPTANVTITVTGHTGTDLTLDTASLTFTTSNWDTAQMVTVTAREDADAADDTVSLTHTASGSPADYDGSITGAVTVTITDPDMAAITISGAPITIAEGDEGTYTVVLATQPSAAVTITPTSGTSATATVSPSALTFTSANWNTAQTITVAGEDNNADAVDQTVTISHAATSTDTDYSGLTPDPVTATVTDDDPTVVALARTGSTGAVGEGGTIGFTITLSRALASGEIIDVPLSISGTSVTTDDWSLALDSNVGNTGVTLSSQATATPRVRFTSSRTANLQLTATADGMAEGGGEGSETYIIALGPNDATTNGFDLTTLGTNVGGGADPDSSANTFNVQVNDPPSAGVTITQTGGTTRPIEGGTTDSYGMTLDIQPTADVTITATSGTPATATVSSSLVFTSTNWNMAQSITVTGVDNDDDAANQAVTITHAATSTGDSTYNGLDLDDVTATVIDDEPTDVAIARSIDSTGAVGEGGTVGFTITLSRALTSGEIIDVPLSISGTNVTTDDWSLALDSNASNTGVTLSNQATATPRVRIAGSRTANLQLTATADGIAEGSGEGSETYTIALGPNDATANGFDLTTLGTNVGGGADPDSSANTFNVQVNDPPPPSTGVTISEMAIIIDEGDEGAYTVVLNTQPDSSVEITVESSDMSAATVGTSSASLTFTASNWDTVQTVTVTGVDDNVGGNRTATISHSIDSGDGDGAGYPDGLAIATVAVTVTDDDEPVASFAVAGFTTNEGSGTYNVVVNLSPAPAAATTITYTVAGTATPGGTDYTTLTGTVVASASASSVNIPVVITDDSTQQEGSETVILTLAAGSGYTVGIGTGVHTLTIADNDAAPVGTPVASFAVASFNTNEGSGTYNVVVNLSPVPTANTTITYTVAGTATPGDDYTTLTGTVVASASASSVNIPVAITDDSTQQEGSETVILTLAAGSGYTVSNTDRVHTLTIADNDAPPVGTGAMQAAQEAWLPRFGLTAVEHLLGGLDYRFSVADQPGLSGNVSGLSAGRALHGGGNGTGTGYGLGADGFGQGGGGGDGLGAGSVDRLLNLSRTLSLRDMLRGSRFVHRGGENGVSVWGQASYSRYEDDQDGIAVDGEVTTGMLGVDRDNGRTLLGLALSYSDGDGDWSGAAEQGELSSTLTSLLPYIRHNVTQRLQVWAAASYGRGELEQTLEQTSATMSTKHDIEQTSASAGVRGILLERPLEEGGLTLTLISDAALARIESDDADGMSGMSADTQRFRMGLEWSWQLPQADGGRLIPELELGMRYDGGDTSDGLGVELGGGISWQLPSRGLTLDLRGRRLLDHEAAERREWGVSGSLRYERQPGSAHGPSLSVRQEYGTAPASGGLDRLLSDSLSDALEEDSSQPGPASGRWSLEGEWGLALDDGATGIPYAGLSSSDAGHDLTLGWRLLSAPGNLDTELDVKALRRRDGEGKTNHGIGAQWKLHW